mmetsp:Transcript_33046/g.87713  ORF Transcript_33046/g.87713 Transcript_33046/m.87713 type:complete len:346 (+) Transcript_33046:309-1346(+)
MDANGEFKGRLQQLFSMPPPVHDHAAKSYAPLPDAGVVGTNKAFLTSKSSKNGLIYEGIEKSRVQMLDDVSSEFDPFTDADSNYGRVLSLPSLSRTNGPVSEDMDANGEFKGRLQQLFGMSAPKTRKSIDFLNQELFTDHKPRAVVSVPEAGVLGTNAAFYHSSIKKEADPSSVSRLPEAGSVGTDSSFLASKVNKAGKWYEGVEKSRVQMLADSIVDKEFARAALPDAGVIGTDAAFYHAGLLSEKEPTGLAPLPDAGVVGTDMSFLTTKSNKAGNWYEGVDKAPVQMLALPDRFMKHGPQFEAIPDAGMLGTNKAFIGKGDGSGQSTKAATQQLYDIDGPQVK